MLLRILFLIFFAVCNSQVSRAQSTQTFSNYVKGLPTAGAIVGSEPTVVLQSGISHQTPFAFPGLSNSFNGGGQNFSGLISTLVAPGTGTPGTANQWTWGVQASINQSNSLASYEKAALYVNSATSDASTNTILRDAVGLISNATSLVSLGRVFGANVTVSNIAGKPSLLTGLEVDVAENNAVQPTGATTNSSAGISVVPVGAFNVTTGVIIQSPSSIKFQDGLVIDANAIAGNAIGISSGYGSGQTDLFTVNSAGQVIFYNTPLAALNNGSGQMAGNFTFGLIAYGKGGTCDYSIFNSSQNQVACVPSGTQNLQVSGTVSAASFTVAGIGGVSCAAGSVSMATLAITNGIVTHC